MSMKLRILLIPVLAASACGHRDTDATPNPVIPTDAAKVTTNALKTLGNWKLTAVTCDGADSPGVSLASLSSAAVSSTIGIVDGISQRVWNFGACQMVVRMNFQQIEEDHFVATDEGITCNAACGAAPLCTSLPVAQYTYPYAFESSDVLLVNLPAAAATGFCATPQEKVIFRYERQ